ncbi:MAG TPA: hypothetical protein VK957_09540 [Lunatimonas sp.]|nr:hypothetical protein [Lunatimonas sp.]
METVVEILEIVGVWDRVGIDGSGHGLGGSFNDSGRYLPTVRQAGY